MGDLSRDLVLIASEVLSDGRGLGAKTHLAGIVSVGLEVSPELVILLGHPIGCQRLDEKEGYSGREKRQTASDPERSGVSTNRIRTTERLDDRWESPSSDERSDLSDSSGDAVVLSTDGGRSGLGCQETEIVSWSDFSEGKEDSVDDGEGGNVFGQSGVETTHDESDDGLTDQTENHGVLRSEGVDDECTGKGSGEVESAVRGHGKQAGMEDRSRTEMELYLLNDNTPGEDNRKGVISTGDVVYDGGRVQTELGERKSASKRG